MYQQLEQPVTEPSAWYVDELQGDANWIVEFDDTDIAEFESGLTYLRRRNLKPGAYAREDFPVNVLDRIMPGLLRELEFGRGCVLLRGLPVERYDLESLKLIFWGFGAHVGEVISQNPDGDLLGYVTDFGNDYTKNNVRGHTTRSRLRPHCDSCDVVALLCVRSARKGGESTFSSSMTIYNEILKLHPEFLQPLYRGFYFDLAGKGVTGGADETTRNRVPVFSYYDNRLSCRFNSKQIRDGAAKAGVTLSALEDAAVDCVENLAMRDDIRYQMDFRPGDIQLLNNHCILHSRNAFEDYPEPARKRLLLRQWWNLPNGRKLAPDFADRLGTGARGGVTVRDDALWREGVNTLEVI
jgi:hypothetical protein